MPTNEFARSSAVKGKRAHPNATRLSSGNTGVKRKTTLTACLEDLGCAKVSDLDAHMIVQEDAKPGQLFSKRAPDSSVGASSSLLWLEVSMDDATLVHVLDSG